MKRRFSTNRRIPVLSRVSILSSVCWIFLGSTTTFFNCAIAQTESERIQALESARSGDYQSALPILQRLAETDPATSSNLYDYLTVLSWAGRHEEALNAANQHHLDETKAPAYVLQALGLSARRTNQPELAERYYRLALLSAPQQIDNRIGLAFALSQQTADTAKRQEADRLLSELRSQYPQSVKPLLAQAYVAETNRQLLSALALHQKALMLEPENREALTGVIRLASRIGAPAIAKEVALQHPGVLTESEIAALTVDVTAQKIQRGIIDADLKDPDTRLDTLRSAIADTDALARKAAGPEPISRTEARALFDRITALCETEKMREAINLSEQLKRRDIALPAYVKKSLAEAYLYLEQPEEALALYHAYLEADPKDFEAHMGVFYALIESERIDEAQALIDQLVQDTPERIDAYSPMTIRDNPDYPSVLSAHARVRLYADRLDDAQRLSDQLVEAAPFNGDFRAVQASVAMARGRPRQADEILRRRLVEDPDAASAHADRVSTLLELQDFAQARRELEQATALRPESKAIKYAARSWETHNLRELNIEAAGGATSAAGINTSGVTNPQGSHDFFIDGTLFSEPIRENWRAFLHTYFGQAKYPQGTANWDRGGIGAEYRARDITLSAEINDGTSGKVGGSVAGTWRIDDQWSLKGRFDGITNAYSLQALLADIDAHRVMLETTWRQSESREIAVGPGYMHFSDGNDRFMLSAAWRERLWSGPRFRADLVGSLWYSRNSSRDAPYYNPSRDFSPVLELRNDWLTWRDYQTSFRQRLTLTGGAYWQDSFGTGEVWGVHYDHVWTINSRLAFSYGYGHLHHPYDGVQNEYDYGSVTLNWNF